MTRPRLASTLLSLALLAGCDELFSPSPRPDAVRVVDTSARTGTVGDPVAPAPAVEVVDRKGKPVSGVAVTWTVSPDGGTVSATAGRTDSRGVASTGWTLPTRTGRYTLTATVEGFEPVVFGAAAGPGAAARVILADTIRRLGALDTVRLSARAIDRYDNPVPAASLAWSSSDTTVARVDATGLVRSLRPGTATVTAAGGTVPARARIEVGERLSSVLFGGDSIRAVVVGTTGQLFPEGRTPDGRTLWDLPFTWTSSDTTVVRVEADGRYRAARRGQATVVASYGSFQARKRLVVTSGVLGILVGSPDGALLPGTSVRIFVQAEGEGLVPIPGQAVELASSDTTVATVDAATRTVRGVRAGTVTITASSEGVTRSVPARVAAAAGSLTLAPDPLLVYRGFTRALSPTFLATDGTPLSRQLLRWSSSAPAVAAVDSVSEVYWAEVSGVAPGEAEVRATGGGLTARASVRVRRLRYASVEMGATHACGTTTEHDALCWGFSSDGQVGTGTTSRTAGTRVPDPALVLGDHRFREVAPGGTSTCALDASGAEYCWGRGYGSWECGLFIRGSRYRCTPYPVRESAGPFASLEAGASGTCGLGADGGILACRTSLAARPDPSLRHPSIGGTHACALDPEGRAVCWGSNTAGESGPGTGASVTTPQRVGPSPAFRQLSAGDRYTCGVTPDGEAYCWGTNANGQLGSGEADPYVHSAPVRVAGGLAFLSVTAGSGHACGITRSGDAYCWGSNEQGALGTGSFSGPESCGAPAAPCSGAPVLVTGGLRWRTISAGSRATCGIATDDALYCWGDRMQMDDALRWSRPTRMPNQL